MSASGAAHPLVVVGAGAAGLWAAARAAELGLATLLLEKTRRTGTKVLASGGTRCNLTTTLGPDEARALFGPEGARFLRPAFRALPPLAVRERFHELGVPTVTAPLEKVFPASQRARDVRDALERWARAAGVEIRVSAGLASLEHAAGAWQLRLSDGESLRAERVILAPGGKSYAGTGTTGDGYAWLETLDLEVVPPVPGLVPLSSPAKWVRELAGVALQEVEVRLVGTDGRTLARRARPVVFTHAGLSGPGVMDVSVHVARAQVEDAELPGVRLDLVPGRTREELRALLIELPRRRGKGRLVRAVAEELELPRRLVRAVLNQARVDPDQRPGELTRPARHALVEGLKGLALPVDGTLGFDRAEVTAGGLTLSAVDPGSLHVRGRSGLYVCGELLDLAGPIGGLNFQSAFATAELAAQGAARKP